MIAAEFIRNNADILTGVMHPRDFNNLTDGCVVFVITTTPGSKNIQDRAIRNAGYYMVVSTYRDTTNRLINATVIGLTAGGYAKIDVINLSDLEYKGNKMVFLCKPLPLNDHRQNYHFM